MKWVFDKFIADISDLDACSESVGKYHGKVQSQWDISAYGIIDYFRAGFYRGCSWMQHKMLESKIQPIENEKPPRYKLQTKEKQNV